MNLRSEKKRNVDTQKDRPPEESPTPSVIAGSGSRATSIKSDVSSDVDDLENDLRAIPRCGRGLHRRLQRIYACNLKFNPIDPGNWDEWGVYYCSSRFGRHTQFNANYFALVAIIVLGQSNFFHLIYLMQENGGLAFLLVLLMTYVFFGYPAYIMEMLMGQYSGRKPLQMIRLLLPVFSGLGIALYIRTFFRAVNVLGHFANCLYHAWDLLFCKGASSVLLKRIVTRERDHRKFKLFSGLAHPAFTSDPTDGDFDEIKWIMFACGLAVVICFKKLKEFGAGMKVVVRLLLLFITGYTANAYNRIKLPGDQTSIQLATNTMIYLPLKLTFKPNWIKLLNGGVWVKATIFVMNSLELGTLVHPYLGSKVFFHYRCTRDGIYLILLVLTWYMIGMVGILLWLGYVGITEAEIRATFREIDGHYGMFVVFIMKHLQAELTQQVESDTLLFCSVFYFIIGTSALFSCICYIYVLADCATPECGHSLIKVTTLVWYVILFGVILFPLGVARDGLRHLIFLSYYGGLSWIGLFLIVCFSIAVSFSQGMARVLYDFYNVLHLKGYEVRTHYYLVPKVVMILFIMLPLISMLRESIERTMPAEGATDWSDTPTVIMGNIILISPVFAVVFGALFYRVKERTDKSQPIFQPHRDFYKNKYHISVCFKDFLFFDPEKIMTSKASKKMN